jgi:hypothetical protein
MADFNIRSDSVDVEQIMKQIRGRIREKRGVDYTEEQIRELATVRLEKFLDPKNLRSDLLDQFRRSRPAIPAEPRPVEPPYTFDDQTLFTSHRGALVFIRRLLLPLLKLFFNPNTLNQILHTQAQFNVDMLKREQRRKIEFDRSRAEWNALYYEVLHNLVLETTRSGIEIKNLKMRLDSLASRLDFSERRVRALEGVVQYRPEAVRRDRGPRPPREDDRRSDVVSPSPDQATIAPEAQTADAVAPPGVAGALGEGGRRRRRRRRGRRGMGGGMGTPAAPGAGGPQDPQDGGDLGPDTGDDDEMDESRAPEAREDEERADQSAASASADPPDTTRDEDAQ